MNIPAVEAMLTAPNNLRSHYANLINHQQLDGPSHIASP